MIDILRHKLSTCATTAQTIVEKAAIYLRYCYEKYPPLAGFLVSLIALSAIPVGVFVTYSAIVSCAFFALASVAFVLVNGFWIAVGGGVTLLVLAGVTLFTTFVFFWVALAWFGYRTTRLAASKAIQAAAT